MAKARKLLDQIADGRDGNHTGSRVFTRIYYLLHGLILIFESLDLSLDFEIPRISDAHAMTMLLAEYLRLYLKIYSGLESTMVL